MIDTKVYNSIVTELNDIGYFDISAVDNTTHTVIKIAELNKYIKVLKKYKATNTKIVSDIKSSVESEIGISMSKAGLDYIEELCHMRDTKLTDFHNNELNQLDFLPSKLIETENYVFYEWFNDYIHPQKIDFLTPINGLTKHLYSNASVDVSDFCKDIISKIENIHHIENKNAPSGITLQTVCVTDIVVKYSIDRKIEDWKYIDLGSVITEQPNRIICTTNIYPGYDLAYLGPIGSRFKVAKNTQESKIFLCDLLPVEEMPVYLNRRLPFRQDESNQLTPCISSSQSYIDAFHSNKITIDHDSESYHILYDDVWYNV